MKVLIRFPLTPGHEFAGVIEKVGADVHGFRQGERVVADNTILCGECYYCRRNQPLYCENFYSLGVTGPGGFAGHPPHKEGFSRAAWKDHHSGW